MEAPTFNLDDMQPNGFKIFEAAQKITKNVAYFLPRNTNVDQVIVAYNFPYNICI